MSTKYFSSTSASAGGTDHMRHVHLFPSRSHAMRLLQIAGASALLLTITACGSETSKTGPTTGTLAASAPTGEPRAPELPAGLTLEAAAQLDSGNVAFRLKQYPQALAFYEHAVVSVPNHPAPWYGIYMVAMAQGKQPLADSALAMVSARSGGGELLQQGVSAQHGQGGESPQGQIAPRQRQPVTAVGHPVIGGRR